MPCGVTSRRVPRGGASPEDMVDALTPEAVEKYLYTYGCPDPDLIIRTSGEIRLSGFVLWQSAFSEFYFCNAYWPAFRKIDFLRAIRAFQQRQRQKSLASKGRFGTAPCQVSQSRVVVERSDGMG